MRRRSAASGTQRLKMSNRSPSFGIARLDDHVRPVGAPDQAFGRRLDQRAPRTVDVGDTAARCGEPVRRGQLDPGAAVVQQAQQRLEAGAVRPARRRHVAEVAEHHRHGRSARAGGRGREIRRRASGTRCASRTARCAAPSARQRRDRQHALAVLQVDELKRTPRTPRACSASSSASDRRRSRRPRRRAAAPDRLQRIEHRRVVGAVDARLHEHGALDAERVEHVAVVGQQRVGRRVDAVRRIRIARGRAANMRMAIAGQRRRRDGAARAARGRAAHRSESDRSWWIAVRDDGRGQGVSGVVRRRSPARRGRRSSAGRAPARRARGPAHLRSRPAVGPPARSRRRRGAARPARSST